MARSIAYRIRRAVVTITLVSLLLMLAMTWVAQDAMEDAILADDLRASHDLIVASALGDEPRLWNTSALVAFYEPTARAGTVALPALFAPLPFPYSGEVEVGEHTYLVTLSQLDTGRLYLARNITAFETREQYFQYALLLTGAVALLLALLLARLASTRLIQPLQALTQHIETMSPDRQMARAPTQQEDQELRTIAQSFNRFLDALEAFMRREQSLVSLSSHELRTPTAVIAGALTILEQRGNLGPDDLRTLARAQRATEEMRNTIDLILKLGRQAEPQAEQVRVDLAELLDDVLDELRRTGLEVARVQCELAPQADLTAWAEPALAKMLVRNLLHNALRHTSGQIHLQLAPGYLRVADDGPGLPAAYRSWLTSPHTTTEQRASLSGLGLVIVTLIGERLGWRVTLVDDAQPGTTLEVRWPLPDTA